MAHGSAIGWSYAFYAVCYEALVLGGGAWLVTYHGWWPPTMIVSLMLSAAITTPENWRKLWEARAIARDGEGV